MTGPTLRYDLLVQRAMQNVVAAALVETAENGLPGEHHFYITFSTQVPGVEMPPWLADKYGEEMTIVLQHEFWDLEVDEDGFAVSLNFNKVPARLVVPFAAIKNFYDPSVKFGLQFIVTDGSLEDDEAEGEFDEGEDDLGSDERARDEADTSTDGDQKGEVISLDSFRKK